MKLKDIAKIQIGISAPKQFEEKKENNVPFIRAGLLEDLCNNKESFTEYLDKKKYKMIPKNTVIFAKSGMSALKNRVYTTKTESIIVGHIAGIICDEKLLKPKYLEYFLKYNKPSQLIQNDAYPSIRTEDIKKIEINVPSTERQKLIIRILDCINTLIELRKKSLENCNNLIKSQFVEMFENKDFDYIKIKDVIDSNISKAKKRFSENDIINYVDISSIDNQKNKVIGYTKYILKKAPSRAQQCIQKNDILISTVRPNLKNIAVNEYDFDNCIGTSGFCVLRSNKCNYHFLKYIVLSEKFTQDMVSLTTGANYPAIKDSDVKNFKIVNPPIELQNKFAQIVEQIDKQKFVDSNISQIMEKMMKL